MLVKALLLLLLDRLRRLRESLDLQPLGGLEECRQLVLRHVYLTSVHELEDGGQVLEGHVLQDYDRVLGGVLLKQRLEIGRASGQDHLVGLARLPVAGQGYVSEGLLVPQVLEGRHHVCLEVVPAETKLLLIALGHLAVCLSLLCENW